MLTSQPSVMLIRDSPQPEPMASTCLPASRASWISPFRLSPAYLNNSKPASNEPSGLVLSTSKSSATVVLCVTWAPFHSCGPGSSLWIISPASRFAPAAGSTAS